MLAFILEIFSNVQNFQTLTRKFLEIQEIKLRKIKIELRHYQSRVLERPIIVFQDAGKTILIV